MEFVEFSIFINFANLELRIAIADLHDKRRVSQQL